MQKLARRATCSFSEENVLVLSSDIPVQRNTCGNADDTCQFNLTGVTLKELRRKEEEEREEAR